MTLAADRTDIPTSSIGAWYGLGTLILASMAANSIVALFPLLTEGIKHDIGMSDSQFGALRGIGTTLVSAIASYPIGWLADRIDRRLIFAVCVLIWSAATAASGLVHSYAALFSCAIGIAFGEAVLGPVIFAMIPELFQPRQRMLANSVFFVAQLLGLAAGLAIAGLIIGAVDTHRALLPPEIAGVSTWRLALIAHALPSLVLIPLIVLIPLRRRRGTAHDTKPKTAAALPYLRAHVRTLLPVFVGFGAIGAANFTVFGWIAVAIVRQLAASPAEVGIALGQVFAVASILGVVVANWLARRFAGWMGDNAAIRIAQFGAATAAGLSCLYLLASSPTQFYAIAVFQIAASMGGLTLSPTVVQGLAPANIRARVFAVAGLFYTIFGALSPLAVGVVSDALGPGPEHLIIAMLAVGLPLFVLGIALLQAATRGLGASIDAVRVTDRELTPEGVNS